MLNKYRFAFLILIITVCSIAQASDIAKLRQQALRRQRKVIVNNDGCDVTSFPANKDGSLKNIYAFMLDHTKGAEVDTVTYTPYTVAFALSTNSKVSDIHTAPHPNKNKQNLTPKLIDTGTDSLSMAVEYCRKNDLEIFATMRVNDTHDYSKLAPIPEFKKANPQLLFGADGNIPYGGTPTGYDFTHKEVRERFAAILREFMENYDIDGIELDFMREHFVFKSVAMGNPASDAERKIFTDLMRQIRRDADSISLKRGKYLMIAIRVSESPGFCFNAGLDIECWMKEKLVDLVFAGGDRLRLAPYKDMVELGKIHQTKVYSSVDLSWLKNVPPPFSRDNKAMIGASASALVAGADGIYYFNYFYSPDSFPLFARDSVKFNTMPKSYFASYNYNNYYTAFLRDFQKLPELSSRTPQIITPQTSLKVPLEIGDNFKDRKIIDRAPNVKLYVKSPNSNCRKLQAMVNGTVLAKAKFADRVYEFQVPPESLEHGMNDIRLSLADDGTKLRNRIPVLSGKELLVLGKNQAPWRRVFRVHDRANSEKIVEDSYRILDSGTGKNEMANLAYPLPDLSKTDLNFRFQMLLEDSTAPEAVVVRIATGENVEVITFEKNKIGCLYAAQSVNFNTHDKFHKYDVHVSPDSLMITADSKKLLTVPLTMSSKNSKSRLSGFLVPPPHFINEQSILIGSISGPGTGSARWKNLEIEYAGLPVNDLCLAVRFSAPDDLSIAQVAKVSLDQPDFYFKPQNGLLPKIQGVRNTYEESYLETTNENTLIMNHINPNNEGQNIRYKNPDLLGKSTGMSVFEWKVRVWEQEKTKPFCFSSVFYIGDSGKAPWHAVFRLSAGSILSPWNDKIEIKGNEWHIYRFILNNKTGQAALLIDGELASQGKLTENDRIKSEIGFGDGSKQVGGKIELEYYSAKFFPE